MTDLTLIDKYDENGDEDDGEIGCLTTMDMAPEGGCRS